MNIKTKKIAKLLDEGYAIEDILKKQPRTNMSEVLEVLEKKDAFRPPPSLIAKTTQQIQKKQELPVVERNELLATHMEKIVQSALDLFRPEEIIALTPRERILLVSNFTEKMRLLRGESTDNVAINSFVNLVEELSDGK